MSNVEYKRALCFASHANCGVRATVEDGKITKLEGDPECTVSQGRVCERMDFQLEWLDHPKRCNYPLKRVGARGSGKWERLTWDQACAEIGEKLRYLADEYGPESVIFSHGTGRTDEWYEGRFFNLYGSPNLAMGGSEICWCPTYTNESATYGQFAAAFTAAKTGCVVLWGHNPAQSGDFPEHWGYQDLFANDPDAKLIVVDPRDIGLAAHADIHLKLRPGTNVAFANGIVNYLIQHELYDEDFVRERTEGFEILAATVRDYTPELVEDICGIDRRDLVAAAKMYAAADAAAIMYCLGVTEHSTGTDGVMALSNIAMISGNLGKPGGGVNPLRGQNNVQGACDMGAGPDDLPGYQKVADPEVVRRFEKAWGVALPRARGIKATECFPAMIEGGIKGLFLFGEDPVRTDPDTHHVIRSLEALEFFVVDDLFMTETAKYADVILPGRSYAEKEGTFTNTERRVQRVRKAVGGPEGAWLDTDIFTEVMNRMGYAQPRLSAAEVMDEIASVTPTYGGMSHARLDGDETAGRGLQWPCPSAEHPGTPILHMGEFAQGLGAFSTPDYQPSAELPDAEYPLVMMTGRILYQYNACAMTARTDGVNEIANRSFIELNTCDAEALGIADGDIVRVSSRRGSIESVAHVSEKTSPGHTWMPFHFQDGNSNWLTIAALDRVSKAPEYKVCAVKVEKA